MTHTDRENFNDTFAWVGALIAPALAVLAMGGLA